jgi:hypothetical protein
VSPSISVFISNIVNPLVFILSIDLLVSVELVDKGVTDLWIFVYSVRVLVITKSSPLLII